MKKLFASLLALLIPLLSACNKDNSDITNETSTVSAVKTADMLDITTRGMSYTDCLTRYYSVISAVKNKVQILENEHNKIIKIANEDRYFLDENYILTFFDPFLMNSLFLTEGFKDYTNPADVNSYYTNYSNGADIRYEIQNATTRVLYFTSENSVKEFRAEYNKGNDSFRYTAYTDTDGNRVNDETLEFVKITRNIYLIQSQNTRCYVEFDDSGKITYFCCTVLKNSTYSESDSIYDNVVTDGRSWALAYEKDSYISIHTYENGVMTPEECSSGPWKSVSINESDYASAFLF